MPLGLPPHLATQTTSAAVARAAHAGAAVCLVGVGILVLSVQAFLPSFVVWTALIALVPMIVLVALLDRSPSFFIAASYLVIGGLCVFWFTLISSNQLDTPVANDNYTIVVLKIAMILVIGAGPHLGASMLWTTAAFGIGELASLFAHFWMSVPWHLDVTATVVWFIVVGVLALLRVTLQTSRDSQIELYRAASDEMLAAVRRSFESRATALLHDTVLNQLAVIATTPVALSTDARASIRADLALIGGQEWFDLEPAADAVLGQRAQRLRGAIDEAAAGEVRVDVVLDAADLDALSGENFDEFSRAIAQCIVNVRRHADTNDAEVVVTSTAAEVSAMVIDGGKGFDVTERPTGRIGVGTSIVGRLETIGGSATVWSQPGKGTSVLLRVPLPETLEDGGCS